MQPTLPQVPVSPEPTCAGPVLNDEVSATYDSEMHHKSSRKGFTVETANDLLTNEATKALQRVARSNSITSTSATIRAELERRNGGVVDWTKQQTRDKLRDTCKLMRKLFGAFEEVEHLVEDEDASLARRAQQARERSEFKKMVGEVVTHNGFTSFYLVLTIYALFGPDICAIYGHTPLNTEDRTLAIFNTVVLFFFVMEGVLHMIGIPGYTCSTRFWVDTLATFSIVGDTILGTELLQSDAFVAMRGSRLTRILRVGGRSSKFVRILRMTRLAQVMRLVPKLQEWIQRSTNELAFELWHKRVTNVAKFLKGGDLSARFTAEDWEYLTTAMDIEFPVQTKKTTNSWIAALRGTVTSLARPGVAADLAWVNNPDGGTWNDAINDLIALPVGKRSYQSCMDDINCMKESCAIVENASGRLTLKVCILVLMLLLAMQLLLSSDTDWSVVQGLAQVDRMASDTVVPASPANLCGLIGDFAHISVDRHLVLLAADYRFYWRPGCMCCDPDSVAVDPARSDIVMDEGFVEEVARGTGLEVHELLMAEVMDSSGAVRAMAMFDTHEVERAFAVNNMLQTVTVVILLTSLVVYFSSDMKKLSNDNVLHPLWEMMDDMCSLQCIELLSFGGEECPFVTSSSFLYQKHFARLPAVKWCCRQKIPVAQELVQLRGAFDKLRTAISSWSKFVPVVLLKHLLEARVDAQIGCNFHDVAVVFVAVADFDNVVEDMTAQEVLTLMSGVLNGIYEALTYNNGVMLEFIGDEVLAVFNAPSKVSNFQERAINSALEAQENVSKFRSDVSLLCSVHRARVLVGNLGSPTRMKYGVLGDGVNLSARLKSLNTRHDTRLLVSSDAMEFQGMEEAFVYRPVGHLILKGRTTPTRTFEVLGKQSGASAVLKNAAKMHIEAFRMFREQKFADAKFLFTQVRDSLALCGHVKEDKVSKHFISLCENFLVNPPPAGWDGSEHMKKKAFH